MDIEKLRNKYLKCSYRCPVCDSDDIEGGSVEIDAGGATQEVSCKECDTEWTDIYKLDDVMFTNIDTGGD